MGTLDEKDFERAIASKVADGFKLNHPGFERLRSVALEHCDECQLSSKKGSFRLRKNLNPL